MERRFGRNDDGVHVREQGFGGIVGFDAESGNIRVPACGVVIPAADEFDVPLRMFDPFPAVGHDVTVSQTEDTIVFYLAFGLYIL